MSIKIQNYIYFLGGQNFVPADQCETINGEKCIFPFKHAGKYYLMCTSNTEREGGKFWCATKVNAAKKPTKTGYCKENCPKKCKEYVIDFSKSF